MDLSHELSPIASPQFSVWTDHNSASAPLDARVSEEGHFRDVCDFVASTERGCEGVKLFKFAKVI